jgi:hypothetical protein
MKIYTIAHSERVNYGHGDNFNTFHIIGLGDYESEGFPKCFRTHEQAEKYREEIDKYNQYKVVDLELVENG